MFPTLARYIKIDMGVVAYSVIAFLVVSVSGTSEELFVDVVQGTYHAFWAVLVEPKEHILAALPNKSVALPDDLDIPTGKAIIVLEMGKEHNCGPIWPPSLRTNFGEFKLEIPFVNLSKSQFSPFMYKGLILQDKEAEVLGSELVYDLNAQLAKLQMNATSYVINMNGKSLVAVFQNVSGHENFKNASDYPEFNVYKQISSQSWFGKSDTRCARHSYDFDHALVRPVTMSLTASNGLFPSFNLSGNATARGINYPLGVAEVWANFTISAPSSCIN
jgi:hypothetical protein